MGRSGRPLRHGWALGDCGAGPGRSASPALHNDVGRVADCRFGNGMVHVEDARVTAKGRLGPGETLGFNLDKAQLYMPGEIAALPRGAKTLCLLDRADAKHQGHRAG